MNTGVEVLIFSDFNGWLGLARYAGAYRIASELRKQGFTCQVVDFFTNFDAHQMDEVIEKFVGSKTLFVGFSTTLLSLPSKNGIAHDLDDLNEQCRQYYDCRLLPYSDEEHENLFSKIKRRNPKTKIVVGGGKVLYQNGHPLVDYWISGPADQSVVSLAQFLKGDSDDLSFRELENGNRLIFSKQHYPFNCFRDSEIKYEFSDVILENECLPIEISRGCAFNCSFCTFEKRENSLDYVKKPEVIRSELIRNFERFGTTRYMFCDDTYNDSLKKVKMLHSVFSNLPFQIEFTAYSRLDVIHSNPEMIDLLPESGAKSLFFGIETLNGAAGRSIGKPLGKEKSLNILSSIKKAWHQELFTAGSFIFGLPGETQRELQELVHWVHETKPVDSWFFNVLQLADRSHLHEHGVKSSDMSARPEKFGLQATEGSIKNWSHPHMTFIEASKMQADARKDTNFQSQNRLWTGHGWINLMWNLGHSSSECHNMVITNIDTQDSLGRKAQKLDQYYQGLMNLDYG